MIENFKFSQEHNKAVVSALEAYQTHRQGMLDASQRLALALQEAAHRNKGAYGESLGALGVAHQKAAQIRKEAHSSDEIHVLSKLRVHNLQAATDCRKSARNYE